jgi:hypothetical protein
MQTVAGRRSALVTEYQSLVVEKTRMDELIDVDERSTSDSETIKTYGVRLMRLLPVRAAIHRTSLE